MRAKAAWAMAAMGSAAADYMAVITMAVKVRDLFVRRRWDSTSDGVCLRCGHLCCALFPDIFHRWGSVGPEIWDRHFPADPAGPNRGTHRDVQPRG